MTLINSIPTSSRPIQTESIFTATFNNPGTGLYDFNISTNKNIEVHPTNDDSIYFLDRMNFSLDIDEAVFKKAILVPPSFSIKSQNAMQQKLPTAIPLINYVDNTEYQYFYEESSGQPITARFSGVLAQIPELVGVVTIKAFIQLNVYEVRDQHWINNYNALKDHQQGENLLFRGRSNLGCDSCKCATCG
jgi:hypothetical protein